MAKKLFSGAAGGAVPVVAAGLLTVGSTLGLRAFLRPEPGTPSEGLYKWAPAIGAAVGLLGAGAMLLVAGKKKGAEMALPAALTSAVIGAGLIGSEYLNASKPGAALALGQTGALPAGTAAGTAGLAALMPEFNGNGMGAIVMDQLNGMGSPYGETVRVAGLGAGIRPEAFGNSPF